MKTAHVAIVLSLLGMGGVLIVREQRQGASVRALKEQVDRLQVDAEERDRTKAQAQATLLRNILVPQAPASLPSGAVGQEQPREHVISRPKPESKELEVSEMVNRFDDRFSQESADPSWSTRARASLQENLRPFLSGDATLRVRSLDCRSTTCRLEVSYPSLERYRQFMQEVMMVPSNSIWLGPTFSTVLEGADEQGPVVAVSFLSKDGHVLSPHSSAGGEREGD